jgi:HEAT repeat protein
MLIGVLLAGMIGGIAWLVFRAYAEDPLYQGKRLSTWLQGYDATAPLTVTRPEADEAVRHFGTKAIPILLRRMVAKESLLKNRLITLAQRQHRIKVSVTPASVLQREGEGGLLALGPEAKGAVPPLIDLYEQNITGSILGHNISRTLGELGPMAKQAVPALIQGLGSTNGLIRGSAIVALGQIHSEPQLAVPALIQCLSSEDAYIQMVAVVALGAFGIDAKPAMAELIRLYEDPQGEVKHEAMEALIKIDPEGAAKAGVK